LNPIAIDFETFYSKKLKCTVFGNLPEEYVSHPLFDTYMVSVCDGSQAWSGHPKDFNWSALEGKTLLSHNRRFDNTVLNKEIKEGRIPRVNWKAWHCTANLTSYLCNRRSLDQAIENLYKIKVDKSARSDANGKRWPQDFTDEERKQMLAYAKDDAIICHKLWMDYSHKMPEIEHRLSDLTIEQGMRGVQIDVGRLNEYLVRSHEMLGETTKLIPWMQDDASDDWDEFNLTPTATFCIEEQCRRAGIVPPPKKTKDAEGYLEWEALHVKNHPWITAVSSWRSINKLYKTFVLVKRRLDENDVMPFSLKYFGAHTGRWSGDARLNMQNMRKLPVVCNENGLMETNERRVLNAIDTFEQDGAFPSWVRHTLDFRALIIPRPGKKMIVSDLSQIEPRVLAWVAGNQKFLELVAQGYSPYEAHAKASMKYTEPTPLKDTDAGMYKLAKARVLGLGYGCGWEKFITVAYAMARLDITKDDPEFIDETNPYTGVVTKDSGYGAGSKAIVKQFRADNPEITNLWKSLDEKFKGSVGEDFKVTLPSGRVMRYEDVRASLAIEQDRVTKKPTKTWKFTAMSDARRKAYYGGKLTENIVQAIARDVFGVHVIRMEDRGWRNLFSAHDEAILEVDQSVTAKDVEKEMGHCPEWLKGCPIAAEAKEVSHYLK